MASENTNAIFQIEFVNQIEGKFDNAIQYIVETLSNKILGFWKFNDDDNCIEFYSPQGSWILDINLQEHQIVNDMPIKSGLLFIHTDINISDNDIDLYSHDADFMKIIVQLLSGMTNSGVTIIRDWDYYYTYPSFGNIRDFIPNDKQWVTKYFKN